MEDKVRRERARRALEVSMFVARHRRALEIALFALSFACFYALAAFAAGFSPVQAGFLASVATVVIERGSKR